eukprot:scaffold24089_cov124-Isochrysis_galbana.AAC.1
MRCPGRHRAVPTTGSGGPCAGPQGVGGSSVYKRYPAEEYGQAAVRTLAKQTIATFILDYQRQCGGGTHPIQDIKIK